MRHYGGMAARYLKQQRKRTILTIVGIVLSVALISALGTMGQTLKDNLILNTEYESGSFYFGYEKPTSELYETLSQHLLVDRLGIYRTGEETSLANSLSVQVDAVDPEGFKLLPIHLHEGRLPSAANELAVEQWILDRLPGNPKLGDSVSLNGPEDQPIEYRIVGLLNNEKKSQVEGVSRAYTFGNPADIAIDAKTILFLTLKPGVNISAQIKEFAKLNESLFTNDNLLTLMGESGDNRTNTALALIFGTLIGLVVLSTVAVIYNAFHIAVLERIRQFGLLRTLGASPGQIRNLVFREATVLSAIGVPLGLFIGWYGLEFALWLMTQAGLKIMMMETFRLTFHWWIIAGSFAIGFVAVYLAAWLPARKASSVSPVEAAKGAGSIVRESYRRLRLPSPLGLAGIEGRMAANNIRRNRTKFRITTFSIVISITLFIVFHYFTQQTLNMTTTTNENDRIAFQYSRMVQPDKNGMRPPISEWVPAEWMTQVAAMPGVYGVYSSYYNHLVVPAVVPNEKINPDIAGQTSLQFNPSETERRHRPASEVQSLVILYDDNRLKEAVKYVQSGTADPEALAAEDQVVLIQTIKPHLRNDKKAILPLTRYKVGDKLTLHMNPDDSNAPKLHEVTVAGILTQSPFDATYHESMLTIIVGKATYDKLLADDPEKYFPELYPNVPTGFDVAMADGADPEPVRLKLQEIVRTNPGSRLVDIAENQKETRNFNVQMKIFVYVFLFVIGVIGSLNIINTIQTNLLLRRREIGLLQAVGMTMGQIRRMATAEGLWFGVIGSVWGILLGFGLCYFLYKQISNFQGIPFEFPWGASLIACGTALLVGLFSVQGPLRKMEKANLLERLREEA
ncbi:FtsX-like permease family protein [Cohnella terricola]|uniref:ABC transporter permease n=1 Tax=Cohnella terricola TaxID=1289167 RepID=A0A559J580_9BACL|nr:ABC transporter permease [Cohnella terricola]TVX95001.1 ABC transporter permease [Cohnella terricola]